MTNQNYATFRATEKFFRKIKETKKFKTRHRDVQVEKSSLPWAERMYVQYDYYGCTVSMDTGYDNNALVYLPIEGVRWPWVLTTVPLIKTDDYKMFYIPGDGDSLWLRKLSEEEVLKLSDDMLAQWEFENSVARPF
jgi:hypothetical protein